MRHAEFSKTGWKIVGGHRLRHSDKKPKGLNEDVVFQREFQCVAPDFGHLVDQVLGRSATINQKLDDVRQKAVCWKLSKPLMSHRAPSLQQIALVANKHSTKKFRPL